MRSVTLLVLAVSAEAFPPSPSPTPPSPSPSPSPAASCPYLITKNSYSYVCNATAASKATVSQLGCMQGDSEDGFVAATNKYGKVTAGSNTLTCPNGQKIECFIYASYGNVAGSCYECENSQSCGTCQDCVWKDKCGYSQGGCYGNCIDCFGETCDPPGSSAPGCAAYFPEEWGSACIGQESCEIKLSGSGQTAKWMSTSRGTSVSVTETGGKDCHGVDSKGKLKVLAMCGSGAIEIV